MKTRSFRTAALVALAFAAAAPVAAQSVVLRMNPEEGLVSRYVMGMEMHMDSPMMSSDQPFMIATVHTTQSVVGVEGDVVEYSVVTDSADFRSPAMPMIEQQMPDQTGQVQTMKMDTRGRMVSIGGDDMPEEAQQLMGQLGGMGMELPEGPVSPGDSWDASIDFGAPGMPGGGAMQMEMAMTYTLMGVESAGGSQFATIAFEGPITMSANEGGMGMEANGTTTGTLVFDVGLGRLASSEMNMALDMNAGGMQMSMSQAMTMTLVN